MVCSYNDYALAASRVMDSDEFRTQSYAYPGGGEDLAIFYNKWSKHYKKDTVSGGYVGYAHFAAVVSDVLGDKLSRILDAASGIGMVGEELKRYGFTCIDALDPSQDSLDYSRRHQSYREYVCDTLDEHRTKIPNGCYDAVVMCGAFGIPGHVTDACFPELIRITKPGGCIMFTVSTKVLAQWDDKLEAAIGALSHRGLWEVLQVRWIPYVVEGDITMEEAKVPVLKVLKNDM